MVTKRISSNVQAKPGDADRLWVSGPSGVLLLGEALDPGLAARIWELSDPLRRPRICMRFVGGDVGFVQDPTNGTPKERAAEFVTQALPAFDRVRNRVPEARTVMGWNEVQIGDLREVPIPVLEERAKRYAEGEHEVLRLLKAHGYETIGFNMSRGTHHVLAFDPWSPFKFYEPVMADAAMDFFGYHAYWDAADAAAGIAQILSHDMTTFRYRAMYEEVQPAARKPIILTEFGEDGPGGYKKLGTTIGNYVEKMKAVEETWDIAPHWADRYVYLAFMFLTGYSDPTWAPFDPMDTDDKEQYLAYAARGGAWPVVPVAVPPPTGETMPSKLEMLNAAWNSIGQGLDANGIAYNPSAAFVAKAIALKLGPPTGNEYRFTVHDSIARWAGQCFRDAFLLCKEFDWGNIAAYDLLTGEPYVPPVVTPPPDDGGLPPFQFPAAFAAAGFVGVEGTPLPGKTFYRLSPTAAVALGVSAFCEVVVIGADRVPLPGAQVVSRRADGKGEIITTGGDGIAQFNFGAGSAFTPPTQPPFEIFIAEGAVKDDDTKIVSWAARLSDSIFVGDSNATHTESYAQFVGYDEEA